MQLDTFIRAATIADEAAVTEILTASYGDLLAGNYPVLVLAAALPLITKANPKLLACGTYYVAELDSLRIAAVGGWTRERPGTGETAHGEAHLRHFGTHPDFIGRGIGGALVRRCLEEARSQGVLRVHCESTRPAAGFYESLGLRRVGAVDVALPGGVAMPSVRMICEF